MNIEEGKVLTVVNRMAQTRVLPPRLLKFILLFLVLCIGFSIISMNMIRYFEVPNVGTTWRTDFQPCLEGPDSLVRWIRPPSNLMHTMSDKELFWRASFVPSEELSIQESSKGCFNVFDKRAVAACTSLGAVFEGARRALFNLYSFTTNLQCQISAHFRILSKTDS